MNWYIKLSQSIRYFKVTLPTGTTIMRATKPEHIAILYNTIDIEEISREEAAVWDASGGSIQHVYALLGKKNININKNG